MFYMNDLCENIFILSLSLYQKHNICIRTLAVFKLGIKKGKEFCGPNRLEVTTAFWCRWTFHVPVTKGNIFNILGSNLGNV